MIKLYAIALAAALLLLPGCETWRQIEEKLPAVEVCLVYKGQRLCAVKRNGAWFLSAELSAQERAEVETLLPKD